MLLFHYRRANASTADRCPRFHVLLTKQTLDRQRLAVKTVVALDVLFATTSIAAALVRGGHLVALFRELGPNRYEYADAALAAQLLHRMPTARNAWAGRGLGA